MLWAEARALFHKSTAYCAFQWAPTLGGECYRLREETWRAMVTRLFQRAPTLGGECYGVIVTWDLRGMG